MLIVAATAPCYRWRPLPANRRPRAHFVSRYAFGLLILFTTTLAPAETLTLAQALASADNHPDIELVAADRELALADAALVQSRRNLSVGLDGGLRVAKPSLDPTSSDSRDLISDNNLRVAARKNLVDFGRTRYAEDAAKRVVDARNADLLSAQERHRLLIMQRFFDVLTADLQYTTDNEFMTVRYLAFDNARDRMKVGQLSQVDVTELEARFQDALLARNLTQMKQRTARALLADALNRPGQLPGELEDPALPENNAKLPDYDALLQTALEKNPRLIAQRNLLAAAQLRLDATRAERAPSVDAEAEAGYYSRRLGSRDNLRAGVVFSWPFYQGERNDALLSREQAQFHRLQAEAARVKMNLTQEILETYLLIEQLQKAGRTSAKKQAEFRDLAVERARAQYEVELRTNLGETAAFTMQAKLRERSNEYQLALARARLEALVGTRLTLLPPPKNQ